MNIAQHQQLFARDGFTIVDDAFSPEEFSSFRTVLLDIIQLTLNRAKQERGGLNKIQASDLVDAGLLTLRYTDLEYMSVVQRTISRTPEFYRLSTQPKVMEILKAILGMPHARSLYLTNNGVLFTVPNDGNNKSAANIELPWHNDVFHTIPRSNFVQIWAPLIHDADKDIGTLIVCPGSHENGVGKQVFNADDLFFYRYTIDPSEIDRYKPISLELKLGQLLIFSGSLYHKSGKNISEKVRCSLISAYHDIATTAFLPLSVEYKYLQQTPEDYFYQLFGDEKVQPFLKEQS